MVTPSQLNSWRPADLAGIADAVAGHRRALTRQSDELDAARPPSSWTFADGDAARVEHDRLATALATQVSETFGVASALDAAEASIRSAQADLTGALRRASWNDLQVDMGTGAVRLTQAYENSDDLAYAQTIASEIEDQIAGAIQMAQTADDALAAALTTASTTDVNALGGMDVQREITDFQELSEADQVALLLEHPEKYALLDDYASPEVKEQVGEAIGAELDEAAREQPPFSDPDKVEHYSDLLSAFGDDPAVMGPTYELLGGRGLLATYSGITSMMYIGANVDELGVLADELRSGLQVASQDPGFDGETYGRELARYATYDITDDERSALYDTYGTETSGNAALLDYLMRDGDYGDGFIRGVAAQLDEFERGNPEGAALWAQHDSFASPLNGLDGADYLYQPNPMLTVMMKLGEHPDLGLEFFSDEASGADRSAYYFGERDWSSDGFAGISEVAFAIGTDPDNLTNAPEQTAEFVSEYFDQLPENPKFNAENAAGAAEPVADLLKHYMPAVQLALLADKDNPADHWNLGNLEYFPDIDYYPKLDTPDLDGLLKVAFSTDDGVARLAEGVAGLRQMQLSAFVAEHPYDAVAYKHDLQEIFDGSAAVEGYLQHVTGDIAIDGAVTQAQRVSAFTGLVSEAVGLIPVPGADALGDLGKNALEYAWEQVGEIPSERIDEVFDNNVDATVQHANEDASGAENRMIITTYQSLVRAGLLEVPPDWTASDSWAPGGVLLSLDQIGDDHDAASLTMGGAMTGLVDAGQLRLKYGAEFTRYFGKPDDSAD